MEGPGPIRGVLADDQERLDVRRAESGTRRRRSRPGRRVSPWSFATRVFGSDEVPETGVGVRYSRIRNRVVREVVEALLGADRRTGRKRRNAPPQHVVLRRTGRGEPGVARLHGCRQKALRLGRRSRRHAVARSVRAPVVHGAGVPIVAQIRVVTEVAERAVAVGSAAASARHTGVPVGAHERAGRHTIPTLAMIADGARVPVVARRAIRKLRVGAVANRRIAAHAIARLCGAQVHPYTRAGAAVVG